MNSSRVAEPAATGLKSLTVGSKRAHGLEKVSRDTTETLFRRSSQFRCGSSARSAGNCFSSTRMSFAPGTCSGQAELRFSFPEHDWAETMLSDAQCTGGARWHTATTLREHKFGVAGSDQRMPPVGPTLGFTHGKRTLNSWYTKDLR